MSALAVRLGELRLRNPVLSASGTFGHGREMSGFTPPEAIGGLVSKTVTLRPRAGNPAPRLCETRAGLINSIGLENRGIVDYVERVLPDMAGVDTLVFTNIGGESVEELAELAERLDAQDAVDALEVNLSCPNVQGGRLPFATDPESAARAIGAVRERTKKPILAKLSPNVARIEEMARAVEAAGADAITAVNTLLAMAVDWRSGLPGVATVRGGLSGPAIKPVALRCAWDCVGAVSIPVVGCGGIACAEDALEYLVAGCTAIQIGTACFTDPTLPACVVRDMERRLEEAGIESIVDLIGTIRDGRAGAAGSEGREPLRRS